MRVDAFDYELPPERIAQLPASDPETARLLVVPGPAGGDPQHRIVGDLAEVVPAGALVIVNDTRVLPARLHGVKADTGGKVEVFLVRRLGTRAIEIAPEVTRQVDVWRALGKASKPLRFGSDVHVGAAGLSSPRLTIRLLGRAEEDGLLEVALWTSGDEPVDEAVRALGHVPLPPYIKREDDAEDRTRYQTIFARVDGAVAAPTAALHLTRRVVGQLAVRGCEVASVTLHVGLGTFQPVTVEDLDQHPMHAEHMRVARPTVDAVARARAEGRPVVAIGTTAARALESAADPERDGHLRPFEGETRLLIQPGYRFRVVDRLLTNFHLPKSTLLAMVCAFAGTERVLGAYALAARESYRFYSYGDAMLLERA